MPSYTDTSSGYVQWQSARRQAKQVAHDAAIDIIEHYNRMMLNDDNHKGRIRHYNHQTGLATNGDTVNGFTENESPRIEMGMKSKKSTPRGQSKKITTLRAENVDRKGGVFTEGISSLSRQNQFPLSLQRSDVVSENLPDNIKMAREKSRIYLALSQPGSKQSRDSYRVANKGDQSAKSVRTLPPPSSYPWADTLTVPEITRSKTFTQDDRTGLSTRSTLDSRQVASDIHPVKDKTSNQKQVMPFAMFYPSITGAPPNTPLSMPLTYKPKVPTVNIVSLGGETVDNNGKKTESRPRLPIPFKSMVSKGTVGTMTNGDIKQSNKPGIDLPHLPLRYTENKDSTFPSTPRERQGKMSYNIYYRGRRRIGIGQLKQSAKMKPEASCTLDREDGFEVRTPTNDPYASRFRQMSSVTSFGELCVPFAPPAASASSQQDSDNKDGEELLPEPTIMLTVQEEEENGEKGSQTAVFVDAPPQDAVPLLANPEELDATLPPQLSERIKNRTQSLVSNTSMLSVPLVAKELSEARPPTQPTEAKETITLEVPTLPVKEEEEEITQVNVPIPEQAEEADDPFSSPTRDPSPHVDTARTVATQTSLPFDPDLIVERRPTVVKIKTLSMFPDISGAEVSNGVGSQVPCSAASEPFFRMSHGEGFGDSRGLGLPDLKTGLFSDKDSSEDGSNGSKSKSNTVQNLTFISPLEGQQKAKRF